MPDLDSGLKEMAADNNRLKNSIMPVGLYYLIKILMQLPEFARALLLEDFCNKMTFGFSNVPGPKSPYTLAGYRDQQVSFIMPVGKSIVGSFSIISHVDVIKIGISMDKAVMEDVDEFAERMMQNFDEILGGNDWRNYSKNRAIH